MLFDPRVHEPLLEAAWSPADVEAAIRAIARDADDASACRDWWPVHPLDAEDDDPDAFHGVYLGAAGMLWALQRLAEAGLHEPGHDYARLAEDAVASYLSRPEFDGPLPSLWMGEGGIALVAWLLSPTPELADRLEQIVAADLETDTLELMWGSPGLLLIAGVMLERTGEPRWASAWSAIADRLLAQWGEDVPHFWTQRLYGSVRHDPRTGARADRGRGRTRAPPRAPASRPARPRHRGGADVHRAPRRRARELAALAPGVPRQGGRFDPHPVVPRRARHRGVDRRAPTGRRTRLAAARGRRADLDRGAAAQGREPVPRDRRQRLRAAQALHPHADEVWLQRARRFAMHSAAQVAAARREYGRGRYSL